MKKVIVMTVMMAMLWFGTAATMAQRPGGHTTTVVGYNPGYYVVTPKIRSEINASIQQIRRELQPGMTAKVSVIGSADKTGDQVLNQDLGMERAEAVRTILMETLPRGVTVYPAQSQGDQLDKRMVTIRWKIVPVDTANGWLSERTMVLIALVLIFVGGGILFARPRMERRNNEIPASLPSNPIQETRWFSTFYGGKEVEVRMRYDAFDKTTWKWRTPFPAPNQWRTEYAKAKSAVKSALADPTLSNAIEKAIARGDIRMKGVPHVQ